MDLEIISPNPINPEQSGRDCTMPKCLEPAVGVFEFEDFCEIHFYNLTIGVY